MRLSLLTYPAGGGFDRACGGDRRRRSDRADVGGGAGVGGDRRRHRRTTHQSRMSTDREAGASLPHDRGARSAWHRRSVPRGGAGDAGPGFAGIPLDISDFPTRHNYGLALWQSRFEPILADWVGELGVPILRGREVVGLAQDDIGVDVQMSDGTSLRTEYLVGCDGGRSLIRKAAGIDFSGLDPSTSWMIAEVEMDEEPEFGFRRDRRRHPCPRTEGRRGAGSGRAHGTTRRTHRRAQHGRASRGTRRRLRDGLRASQRQLDLPVHRHDAAGNLLPPRPCAARRGRRTRASPAWRPGPQHRRTGCREPGMEAGPGGQRDVTREPPGHLPRRTASGRCPGAAQHHGASRAQQPRRPSPGPPRHHHRTAGHGRAAQAHRRDALRSRHPLRPRRRTPAARAAHARPRIGRRRRSHARASPCCTTLGPCSSPSTHPAVSDISPWANRVRFVHARHDGVWELPVLGHVAAPLLF